MSAGLGELLREAKARLTPVSASPGLDAQLIAAHVLGESRAHVIAHPEKPLSEAQVAQFTALIDRRAEGEPVAYLLGRRAFYDREFAVSPAVLVPRPETEHLVEAALDAIAGRPLRVVDVGTGSGAIALTIKGNAPQTQVFATDISEAALGVARRNAIEQGLAEGITFLHGDLLHPLIERGVRVDVVLANLPYIASAELDTLAVVRHEPRLALDGGPDGLDPFRHLFLQMQQVLALPGTFAGLPLSLLEIGADQGEAAASLARETLASAGIPPQEVDVLPDLAGRDRVLRLRW